MGWFLESFFLEGGFLKGQSRGQSYRGWLFALPLPRTNLFIAEIDFMFGLAQR